MPEGHTIHRLARDLNRSFASHHLHASSPQGRFDAGATRLDGQQCEKFAAHGKHLLGYFAGGDVLHVHLGLIGKFTKTAGPPVGAVRLRLEHDDIAWDLRGPMVCALGTPELADKVASSVGPDPLDPKADVDAFVQALGRRSIPIGAALLDQKVIAGIGNVYRAELLFLAGIDPRTPSKQLDEQAVRNLWKLGVAQLKLGVSRNRIVTVDPKEAGFKSATSMPNDERLFTYKRDGEPCRRCGTEIAGLELAGRKTWRCPTCQ